jgi:hypothetical protein
VKESTVTIMASRPVRSTERLVDAPTIPAQRPAAPVERFSPLNPPYVSRQAADRPRLAFEALTAPGASFSQLSAIAGRFGVTARELVDLAIDYAERNPGEPVHLEPAAAACPVWCSTRHKATDVFAGYGLSHETRPVELVGDDPALIDSPNTVAAWVERTDDTPGVGTPPRVVVTLTEGVGGHYPGSEGVQGWSGTPEQVEQLGRSLILLAEIARADQAEHTPASAYRVDVFDVDDVLLTSRTIAAVDDQAAEHTARRLLTELGGAHMAAVFTASLVYVGTVTA